MRASASSPDSYSRASGLIGLQWRHPTAPAPCALPRRTIRIRAYSATPALLGPVLATPKSSAEAAKQASDGANSSNVSPVFQGLSSRVVESGVAAISRNCAEVTRTAGG